MFYPKVARLKIININTIWVAIDTLLIHKKSVYSLHMNWNLTSRDIIRAIKKDNWEHVTTEGSHWQFKHPKKKGRVIYCK